VGRNLEDLNEKQKRKRGAERDLNQSTTVTGLFSSRSLLGASEANRGFDFNYGPRKVRQGEKKKEFGLRHQADFEKRGPIPKVGYLRPEAPSGRGKVWRRQKEFEHWNGREGRHYRQVTIQSVIVQARLSRFDGRCIQ